MCIYIHLNGVVKQLTLGRDAGSNEHIGNLNDLESA